MGYVKASARLCSSMEPSCFIEFTATFGTGAVYTVVPRGLLKEVGLEPVERRGLRPWPARGARHRGGRGGYHGEERGVTVIFGEVDETPCHRRGRPRVAGLGGRPIKGVLREATPYLL